MAGLHLNGFEATPVPGSRHLDGLYRMSVTGGVVEVECFDTGRLWRSAVYLKPNQDLILRMPAGAYRFWVRRLGEGAANQIDVSRLHFASKMAFLVRKALQVLARGDGWKVGIAYIRRRMGGDGVNMVEAARLPVGVSKSPEIALSPRSPISSAPALYDNPAVSIIIPTKERSDLLRACIDSLAQIDDVPYEVIVVDNGANAPAMLDYLAELHGRDNIWVVRRDIPFNFSQLCNDGARLARNPLLLFMNDDVEAMDGHWLSAMCAFANREDTGVVGARLLYPSGDLQHGGIATHLLPGPGHPWRNAPRDVWDGHPLLGCSGEVDAVTGACLMVRKTVFDQIGGFDEEAFAVAFNDVDLCLRVRNLGLRIIYTPLATLWHKESQTRAADQTAGEIDRYRRELAVFYERYEAAARTSVFYPPQLRRDTDTALLP